MNPTNDPLIPLTPAELKAILRERARRGESAGYPKTMEGCTLTSSGRLWYVAEFIHQSFRAKLAGKTASWEAWRERAQTLAREVANVSEIDVEPYRDLLRDIATALEGKYLPKQKETDQQRVLSLVNDFCAANPGKLPSRRELIDMGVRGEDVTEVFANLEKRGTIRFPKEKRGRKPGN